MDTLSYARALPAVTAPARRRTHPLLDLGGTMTVLILAGAFLAPAVAWVKWGRTIEASPAAWFELRMLLWSALLGLLLPILQISLHIRRYGGSAIRGNRDFYPSAAGIAGRIARAHTNAIESLGPFAAVVLSAHALNVSNRWTVAASALYLAARAAHALTYALGVTIIRSSAFYAGWIATATIAVVALYPFA